MATAKKLPSGSWRCLAFSHYEPVLDKSGKPVIDNKTGKPKQKRVYESFTSDDPSPRGRKAAELAAAQFQANRKGGGNQISKSSLTLGQAMDDYITSRSAILSPATIREYKRSRKADLQNLMDKKISSITQEDIQNEINLEAITHSPKSVRNMHGLLTAVLGVYRPDFSVHTKLPERIRPTLYIPSDEDVRKLMGAVEGTPLEIPVLLAAFGPMRRSEICALNSDHVQGNIVHVESAMVLDDDDNWVVKQPKSFAGNRYIEFPDFVVKKFPQQPGRIVNLYPHQISNHFSEVLKKNHIPHFRFHDLRHYSASIQHALGIPDAYIMQRGGWGNDSVLKNIYRHTMEQQTKAMNQKANAHFENLCNTKCNTKEKVLE